MGSAQGPRWVTVAVILALHGGALYGLAQLNPRPHPSPALAAVDVSFINDEVPDRVVPEPPQPSIVPVLVEIGETPPLPIIDLPTQPSDRAISVAPVRVASTPPAIATADRSTPKLISTVAYLRVPAPRYSQQSRRLREQGTVVLRVVIDERGQACEIFVETSSGHERLDRAAREAVEQAAFRPYVEDGVPRRAVALIPIGFSMGSARL